MKYASVIILATICFGCTYSVNVVHTQGTASDVVDETDSVTPNTSLSVPISAIPNKGV